MIQGTPNGGLDEIAARTYVNGTDFTLIAYTNAADSLGPLTILADLAQPAVANGYAPIVLDGAWTTLNGIVTYVHSGGGNPTWSASGAWSATVTGVAIIFGTSVVHFKDNAVPFVAAAGKKLAIDMATVVS